MKLLISFLFICILYSCSVIPTFLCNSFNCENLGTVDNSLESSVDTAYGKCLYTIESKYCDKILQHNFLLSDTDSNNLETIYYSTYIEDNEIESYTKGITTLVNKNIWPELSIDDQDQLVWDIVQNYILIIKREDKIK